MEHLLAVWDKLSVRLKEARRIFLFSDYDGTLTPIVETPDLAVLEEPTRELLRLLASSPRFKVVIVSGRTLADLRARVALDGLVYMGNHGLEMEGFASPLAKEVIPIMQSLGHGMQRTLAGIPGVIIENKGLTLSIHYRLVEDSRVADVKAALDRTVRIALSLGKIVVTTGKKVYEVRPGISWGKGEAVREFLEKHWDNARPGQLLPLYMGDDTTDEAAFKAVTACDGISIFVGEEHSNSSALYYLHSPAEVQTLLSLLVQYS